MRSIKVLSLAMTLFISLPQRRYENDALVFTSAYLRSDDIEFEAPLTVDWERLAQTHYGSAKLANPDRGEIRKQWNEIGQSSTLAYNADLPQSFRSGAFYLLAEAGSGFLSPTTLAGAVTYESDQDALQISPPKFSGSVRGTMPSRPIDAGFVVYGLRRPSVSRIDGLTGRNQEPRLSVRPEGAENVFTFADHGKVIPVTRKPAKYPVLQSATLFSFGQANAAYLLIRWAPDKDNIEAGCEHAYSLYRIRDTAELVLENFYDCDV